MDDALDAWNNGHCETAFRQLGYGLHAVQDYWAHGANRRRDHLWNPDYKWLDDPTFLPSRICRAKKDSRDYLQEFLDKQKGSKTPGARECRRIATSAPATHRPIPIAPRSPLPPVNPWSPRIP